MTASPRLHKVMASAGLGSRREIERKIDQGEIRLNRASAGVGATVMPGDLVEMDGRSWRVVERSQRFRTLLYNKPEGEVTTRSDPEGRPTVFDRLPGLRNQRWIAVGRLDINTSGLLVLTTDGELANAMMHPSGQVDREYLCRIHGQVTEQHIQRLREGVELEDGKANFSDIQPAGPGSVSGTGPGSVAGSGPEPEPGLAPSGTNRWFFVVLMEGRNREVRRLWQSQGLRVSRLKRVRYGAAILPRHMRVGHWREISPDEHQILREDVGLPATTTVVTLKPASGARKKSSRKKKKRAG